MANVDRVTGFKWVGSLGGATPQQYIRKVFIPASDGTAVAIGDAVKTAGSADANGIPTVTQAGVGDAVRGVVVAVDYNADALGTVYRPASTAQYVFINEDPMAIYEIQEDGVGGALAATSVGLNADLIDAGVDTTTGTSGMELDSSTAATTNTLALRILAYKQAPDNSIATNAKLHVMWNLHEFRTIIAGT